MRVGNFFVLGSCIVAIAMAVACTQRQPAAPSGDDDDDTSEEDDTSAKPKKKTEPTQAEADNSCLGKAHLAFDKAACTTCMSDSQDCCQATIKCFNGDKECSALQACMSKCGGGTTMTTPGTTTATPQAAFAKAYASIQPTCGSCHLGGTGGAPIFFGADAEATRTLFKSKGFEKPNSLLVTKGNHTGPALTPDQKTLITSWQTAEAAPPATGPGSGTGTGGGGGGGGTGTGGGDAGANANDAVVACQTQCKTDHAAGLPSWQAYNNCSTVLCKNDCQ